MGLPTLTFNRAASSLGRPLAGNDHLSAIIFYTAGSLPSGFGTSDRIKKIFSVADAETLGILDTHADETLGTGGQVTVTGTWIAGEIVRIEIDGASLGQFVLTTTTITSLAAGLVAAINANTTTGLKHGWVATDTDPIILLVPPAKLGVTNNGGSHIVFVDRNATDTGGSAGGTSTDVQITGGVGSYFALEHYHISEYFRLQPKGVLWVAIYSDSTSYDGDEIRTVQDFAEGEIRQMAVLRTDETFAASHITLSQVDLDTLQTEDKPLSLLWHSDMSGTTAAVLPTMATLDSERVTVVLGEDGSWHQPAYVNTKAYKKGERVVFQGASYVAKADVAVASPGNNPGPYDLTNWTLFQLRLTEILGFSVSVLGAELGTVSFAKVSDNIGHVQKFPLSDGVNLAIPGLATGELYKDLSSSLRDTLNDFHYTFIRSHQGATGTWFTDSWTAIVETSDFATIENVRTMDKAVRNIRVNVLPLLNGPLFVDEDGLLSESTIALFKNETEKALIDMVVAAELSAQQVDINPEQDVLATSQIDISVTLVPVGVARDIVFDIGFAVKLP